MWIAQNKNPQMRLLLRSGVIGHQMWSYRYHMIVWPTFQIWGRSDNTVCAIMDKRYCGPRTHRHTQAGDSTGPTFYSARKGCGVLWSTGLSVRLCVNVCLCVSVREHISGIAGPIFTKCRVQTPSGRGSVLLWRRCAMLCTSGFMHDVTCAVMGATPKRGGCTMQWLPWAAWRWSRICEAR